ncbi:MAG: ribonuclease BN (tRNA processing enzyme) [Flavobacterium sp.]|jgi:ribonuclease BN (tRNA processing enzyme)
MTFISSTYRLIFLVALFFVGGVQAKTQVVVLGTGTPNADPDRSGPALAVVVDDVPYLIDFGPGIVRRASAANKKGVAGLAVKKLSTAFVTHLHSDHTAGFSDLILTPWVLERETQLKVFGPKGIKEMADHIIAAYSQDIDMRLNGAQPANPDGYRVDAHEIALNKSSHEIYRDERVRVDAIPVDHGSWKQAFGFKFVTADKTIVISGDTVPSESIIEACKGCDILLHEVYSDEGFLTRPKDWQKYHSKFHTSATELAALANKAKPKLLVLYHQLFWGVDDATLLKEISGTYKGKVVSASDLDVYE